jgi:hypothetical protein
VYNRDRRAFADRHALGVSRFESAQITHGRSGAEGEGEMSNGKKWTSEEDERLLDLKAKGLKLRMIAKSLNRTGASADSRFRALRKAKGK